MLNYIVLICTHLRWCFNFLLYHSFSNYPDQCVDVPPSRDHPAIQISSSLNIVHYKTEDESTVECAVCLCRIEEGEEIRELRCGHLFHKVCLDRWTGFKRAAATCPLCRRRLAPHKSTQGCHGKYSNELDDEPEVLLFGFCSFGSGSDRRDRWWLR